MDGVTIIRLSRLALIVRVRTCTHHHTRHVIKQDHALKHSIWITKLYFAIWKGVYSPIGSIYVQSDYKIWSRHWLKTSIIIYYYNYLRPHYNYYHSSPISFCLNSHLIGQEVWFSFKCHWELLLGKTSKKNDWKEWHRTYLGLNPPYPPN